MYNEEVKKMFLDEPATAGTVDSRRKALSLIERAEIKYNMDICQMSRTESINALSSVVTYELSTIEGIVSCLKAYGKWCYNHGYFDGALYGILGVNATDVHPIEYIRKHIFLTEQELIRELGTVVSIHDGYVESIATVFAWLGIPCPDEILDSDVDIAGRKIFWNGIVIVDGFSDFVADFLSEYAGIMSSVRDNGTTTYTVVKDRSHNTFIKRFCTPSSSKMGKRMDLRTIQIAMNKMNLRYEGNGMNPSFSYKNVMKSGCLSRLYNAEKNGLDVFNRGNLSIVEGYFYQQKYRNITWLYRNYKEAFNL